MSLTTRCPNCGTAFRVQPTQLSARGGRVRCGRCANVFDGVAALVEEGAAPATAPALPDAEPSPQLALFEPGRKGPALPAGEAANEDAATPQFLEEPPRPKRRLLWFLASILALIGFAAQALQYRNEITAQLPDARPHFVSVCALLGCEIGLPRRPKLISIDSSSLEKDGRRENVVLLSSTVRNHAPFAQPFPAIELTLTDERSDVVARRVLLARDYLAGVPSERVARGIDAGGDVAIRVYLDLSGLSAIGYEMKIFFP